MVARIFFLLAILAMSFAAPAAKAQTPAKAGLTVEWIFGDEGRRVASLPAYVWLADGRLMLYDGRQPPSQRTFEVLDPSTGARRSALNMAAAVANLNSLLPQSGVQQALAWPTAFDSAGRRAVY